MNDDTSVTIDLLRAVAAHMVRVGHGNAECRSADRVRDILITFTLIESTLIEDRDSLCSGGGCIGFSTP